MYHPNRSASPCLRFDAAPGSAREPEETAEFRRKMKGRHIAVIGLGISGEGVLVALKALEAHAYVIDRKEPEHLQYGVYVPLSRADGIAFDFAVISPGVPLTSEEAQYFYRRNIPVMGEIEFSYRIAFGEYVCISGTNGKTTTTSLCGEIFRRFAKSRVVGNIGIAAAPYALSDDRVFVTEISSFQIETLDSFRPKIAAVLNITPDHLDRHGTFEAYAALKLRLLARAEIQVMNASMTEWLHHFPDAYLFSHDKPILRGAYLSGKEMIVLGEPVCTTDDIHLMGSHNIENVLAAILISKLYGIPTACIREGVREFRAVEHRIEYVKTLRGIRFYNDSKGTNPDSAIKAVEAMDAPCHLLAGGYEKHSDFTELLTVGKGKISSLSLMGETADRIRDCALALGYPADRIRVCDGLASAVESAFGFASDGEIVLLSPASASWGMYPNFEVRGREFKRLVMELK